MKKLFILAVILFFAGSRTFVAAQTNVQKWSAGLSVKPHPSVNDAEFARQYQINKVYWDKVYTYLKEQDLQKLPIGKFPIDGDNVFIFVTENPTKDYDSTKWESHRNYIDLHGVVSGEEKIGVSPISKLIVTSPYDASKDLANYSGTGEIYPAVPGSFFIFFPSDGHRPSITPGGNKTDKKIVIKIRYAP